MRFLGTTPPTPEIRAALRYAGDLLGVNICWYYRGSFHFRVGVDWTVAITPESAGRLRVETCLRTVPRDRKWTRPGDRARLAQLIRDAVDEAVTTA